MKIVFTRKTKKINRKIAESKIALFEYGIITLKEAENLCKCWIEIDDSDPSLYFVGTSSA